MKYCLLKNHNLKSFIIFFLILFACRSGESTAIEKPAFSLKNPLKEEYLGLFFEDKKIGYFQGIASEIDIKGKDHYLLTGSGVIRLDLKPDKIYTILKEEIILTKTYKPVYFHYSQKIGDSLLEIKGKGMEKDLKIIISSAERTDQEKLPQDVLPLSAAGFVVWKEGIKEGKKYQFKVYVEAMQKMEKLTIEVGSPQIEKGQKIYPLIQKLGNIEVKSYVLENGETYKEESIQGFTLKRIPKEEATKLEDGPSVYDILAYVSIPADINEKPEEIKEITFELSGVDKIIPPSSAYQSSTRSGDKIIVKTSREKKFQEKNVSVDKYLKSTPRIQSSDTEIIKLARSVAGDAKDSREKALRVVRWVNKNIKKSLKDRASALEVLKTREGECESHSMLTAAMLRSLNIPTKIVGGITYSSEQKSFLYHAWNEVFIDGTFVPVDATFGEFPANPAHIKLTEEENTEDISLYLGRVKLRVLEIKK